MLRLARPSACSCASTSRAKPCRHSILTVRQYSQPPSSPSRPARTVRQLDYTAPLFSTNPKVKWFDPRITGWTGWMRNAPPRPPTPSPPPPSNPVSSSPQTKDPADELLERLTTYFSARGLGSPVSQPEQFDEVLRLAEQSNLPLVRAMVLSDRARAARKRDAEAEAEVEQENEPARVAEADEAEFSPSLAHADDLPVVTEVEEPKATRRRRTSSAGPAVDSAAGRAATTAEADFDKSVESLQEFVASGAVSQEGASEVTDDAESGAIAVVQKAWDAFVAGANFDDHPDHLRLATAFVHRLVAPTTSAPSPSSAELAIALRVVDSLLQVFPDDIVAPQPTTVEGVSAETLLQTVLLRTVVNIAMSEDYVDLAILSLHSIDALRAAHPPHTSSPESGADLDNTRTLIRILLRRMHDERHLGYLPTLRDQAWSPSSSIQQAASLFRLLHRWTAVNLSDFDKPVLTPATADLLSSFATEAGKRRRWDLLADTWQAWSPRGWTLLRYHYPLAQWLAGDAPFSSYEATNRSYDGPARSVRLQLFSRFVAATDEQLKLGQVGRDWTNEERSRWVELLCGSRGATASTRSVARRVVLEWQKRYPLGTPSPFLLRASALLSLVRTSLPPYGKNRNFARTAIGHHFTCLANSRSPYASPTGQIEHFDLTTLAQAWTLVGDHDSVAQVYRRVLDQRVLPDTKDVEVIFEGAPLRSLDGALEQVLQAARMGLRLSYEVFEALLKSSLAELVARDHERRKTEPRSKHRRWEDSPLVEQVEDQVSKICEVAETVGLRETQVRQLVKYGDNFLLSQRTTLPLMPHNETVRRPSLAPTAAPSHRETDPRSVLRLLRKARAVNDWHAAHLVFLTASKTSLVSGSGSFALYSDEVLRLTIKTLLAAEARGTTEETMQSIKSALMQVVDRAVAPVLRAEADRRAHVASSSSTTTVLPPPRARTSLITQPQTLDTVLRALLKLDQVDAIDGLMRVMHTQAELTGLERVEPGEAVVRKVVRWAEEREGVEEVRGRKGWVGERARERASKREEKVVVEKQEGKDEQ
ncbi:RHTO0S22e02256g1_1 [Rhodotorula toruloides]|uniref:RHTO0S22e02256g1_1 n=1 Tax=Rhodotorula toruloides TaxID=5286 RepID=A0A061BM71_RHOTO|nr:RHTO0S22e02256g1_1 [Rhodotorula toruloides]